MTISKIMPTNRNVAPGEGTDKNLFVKAGDFNPLVEEHNTLNNTTVPAVTARVATLEGFNSTTTVSNIYTTEVTLTATQIVGTSAGDIGHTDGAILVAAPTSAYALEFVSAVLIYDYATAAYTGGGDDMVVRIGSVAQSSAVSKANCLGASGDKVYRVGAIATEVSLPVGSTINLYGTAFTQPGTAAGVLRVQLNYRIHTTGL